MTRKKILYVITKSNFGGAQRYVFDLATGLPKDEFEVLVAAGGNGVLFNKLADAGIRTLRIESFERDINFIKELRSMVELWSIIRRERPDIVHLNSSKAGGSGAFVARLLGVPRIIFTAHGWPFLERRSFLWRALAWFFSWLTVLLSHTVIVVSDHDFRVARQMPFASKKTIRIYNGISPLRSGSGEIVRSAFPAEARITGTIGELTTNKNQIALIEKARSIPNLYVAIVGEGELRSYLDAKIKEYGLEERVKLFGFVPASDALPGFDAFVLPSLKEGLPYVLLEAKAAGLPIEANRVGGVGEILDAKDMDEFALSRMLDKTIALYRP